MNRLLVYGFRPFGGADTNITEDLVMGLRRRKGLVRKVFEVRFSRRMFIDAVESSKATHVLGLGMCVGSNAIRIERAACNARRALRYGTERKISDFGPKKRYVTWKVPRFENARVTYNAGTYVCNFSMYVVTEHSASKSMKFAFFHIPRDYNLRKAIASVEDLIGEVLEQR